MDADTQEKRVYGEKKRPRIEPGEPNIQTQEEEPAKETRTSQSDTVTIA